MENWIHNGKPMTEISDFPEGSLGFVYLIRDHTNNKFYIGRKAIFSTRKRKYGKREIAAMTNKRLKKYEMVKKEFKGWKEYTGSCEPLNEAIEKGARYTKEILQICKSKSELTYYELKYQFQYGVIEPGNCSYNGNIAGRYYQKMFVEEE